MNSWWKRVSTGLAALLAALYFGQALFAVDNNLSVTAPTQNTDNSPLTDLATVRFYKSVIQTTDCAAPSVVYAVLTTKPATPGQVVTHLDANQNVNGRYCYKATAIDVAGNESAFSNIAFKDVDVLFPKAPSGLTVN